MTDDKEVTVTVTPQDMEFRARAKAAGLPDILISMYGTALRRLVADEREACAKVCEETDLVEYEHCMVLHIDGHATLRNAAAAIRAKGQP